MKRNIVKLEPNCTDRQAVQLACNLLKDKSRNCSIAAHDSMSNTHYFYLKGNKVFLIFSSESRKFRVCRAFDGRYFGGMMTLGKLLGLPFDPFKEKRMIKDIGTKK